MKDMMKRLIGQDVSLKDLRTATVFKISGVPEYTFVGRDKISHEIEEHLETKDGVLLFLGYSKSGKTVFRKKHMEEKDFRIVTYRGNNSSAITSLYSQIATELNIPQRREIKLSHKESQSSELEDQIGNKNVGHLRDKSEEGKEDSISVISDFSVSEIDVNFLCTHLSGQKVLIIIEDYHLVSKEFNRLLSEDLKHFLDEEILFLLIGIPSTPNRALRNNPDLSGRMKHISFDYLSIEEVKEIIAKGTSLLNVEFKEEVIDEIIISSLRNAYLVQYICRVLLQMKNVERTAINKIVFHDKNDVHIACRHLVSEILDNDYSSIYDVIVSGRRAQKIDKAFNQYEEILKAIKYFSIEDWEKGVTSNTISNWAWGMMDPEKIDLYTTNGTYKSEKSFKESMRSGIKGAMDTINDNLQSNSTKQIVYVNDNTLYLTDLIFKFYINWKEA